MSRKSAIKAVSNADVICETDENNIIDCMSSLKKKKIKLNPVKFTEKQYVHETKKSDKQIVKQIEAVTGLYN